MVTEVERKEEKTLLIEDKAYFLSVVPLLWKKQNRQGRDGFVHKHR